MASNITEGLAEKRTDVTLFATKHSVTNRKLDYFATVYNGIDKNQFTLNESPDDYLLYFGRIHHDKGT